MPFDAPVFFAVDFLAVVALFFADDFEAVADLFFAVVNDEDFDFVDFVGLRAVVGFLFDADLAPVDFDFAAAIKNASYELGAIVAVAVFAYCIGADISDAPVVGLKVTHYRRASCIDFGASNKP